MKNIKNKSNSELSKIQLELKTEFEKVKVELIKLYDHWVSTEHIYNEVTKELNDRFGINNE